MILLVPQYVVNFASMASSGRGSLFKKAKVEANTVLHLGQGQTMLHAFHSKKPSAGGDFGTMYLKDPYYMPGEFAVDYLVDESDNASFVNSVTRLTGTAGNIHSNETWAVYANPTVFRAYSEKAIAQASAAYVDLIAR